MALRRSSKIALGVGGLVLAGGIGGVLVAEPLVRSKLAARAAGLGIELAVRDVGFGWGRVRLEGVRVTIPAVPALEADLERVDVEVDGTLEPTAIVITGGEIALAGSPKTVAERLRKWRGAAGKKEKAATSAADAPRQQGRDVRISGLRVVWSEVLEGAEPVEISGVSYRRDAGTEHVGAERLRVAASGGALDLRNASAEIGTRDGSRALERLSAESAALDVTVGATSVQALMASAKNGKGGGVSGAMGAKKGVAVADDAVELAYAKDDRRKDGQPKDTEGKQRGQRLRAAFDELARAVALALPDGSQVDLAGLHARVRYEEQQLNVGPARLRLARTDSHANVELIPGTETKGTPLTLDVRMPLEGGPVHVGLAGGPVSLAALGVQEGDMGLVGVKDARVRASVRTTLSPDGSELAFDGSGQLRDVSIDRPWLAAGSVRGIDVGFSGRGALSLDLDRVRVEEGELSVRDVKVAVEGELEQSDEALSLRGKATVPLAACQAMIDALPEGLAPLVAGVRMSGTFAYEGEVRFDMRHPGDAVVRSEAHNDCRVSAVPPRIAPERFRSDFSLEVVSADGSRERRSVGPGTAHWVPLENVSRYMQTAVLICEDGRFFRHDGFDQEAIENSIKMNLEEGEFVRGASTISMQLAKNLYLGREKTVSRKLQEAVLTMLLEQSLTKEELMELYLNVIEYGPGVYGIGPAASHYFGKPASELTLGQSLYLASILPSPSRQHFGEDGRVSESWSDYLRRLMRLAYKIDLITEEELDEALREVVTYGVADSPLLSADGEEEVAGMGPDDPAGFGTPPPVIDPWGM